MDIAPPYTVADYLQAAERVENLCPGECHPAFFLRRFQVGTNLRQMAKMPEKDSHIAAMNALLLFVYIPLSKQPPFPADNGSDM